MLTRLTIYLADNERFAVQAMAQQELRGLRDQIRHLIRGAARERGLLSADKELYSDQSAGISENQDPS